MHSNEQIRASPSPQFEFAGCDRNGALSASSADDQRSDMDARAGMISRVASAVSFERAMLQAPSTIESERTAMLPASTINISINRPWTEVYEAIWRPDFFPRWASGLSQSGLVQDGDVWKAQGPEGPITIRFAAHNELGVMDHHVDLGGGVVVYVPLRVIENGAGAEVLLTLFRQPDMTEEKFRADAEWVRKDLAALKAIVEGRR
jgi:hypothetical protein